MLRLMLLAGVSALAVGGSEADASTMFTYTGATQTWTVPTTGAYRVDVWGASGGGSTYQGYAGGRGIGVEAVLHLAAGDQVTVAVGGAGQPGYYSGGGGGGSVFFRDGAEFVGAGGGGGAGNYGNGVDAAPASYCGGAASGVGLGAGAGGSCLAGGQAGAASGGAGFADGAGGYGGGGFLTSAGKGGAAGSYSGAGGFGAGGGAGGYYGAGGGGGGVSGGGGGGYNSGGGGGGGSYAIDQNMPVAATTLGYRQGDGLVEVSAVPEPATWSLMLSGLGFLGYVLRRRFARMA